MQVKAPLTILKFITRTFIFLIVIRNWYRFYITVTSQKCLYAAKVRYNNDRKQNLLANYLAKGQNAYFAAKVRYNNDRTQNLLANYLTKGKNAYFAAKVRYNNDRTQNLLANYLAKGKNAYFAAKVRCNNDRTQNLIANHLAKGKTYECRWWQINMTHLCNAWMQRLANQRQIPEWTD